ncbi:MAG: hypothetical protein WA417_00685 [Stellaceae bacterium]|jgi:hypothetical protein
MPERTTVRLPGDLLERARHKAAAEGRTLTSLIEEGLNLVVSSNQKAVKRRRILPRVSSAEGGLVSGVDLGHTSAIDEADDLNYLRRMQRFK